MIRVILDVNVLVSALLSPNGVCARIVERWTEGGFDVVASDRLLDELRSTLSRPRIASRISERDANALQDLLDTQALRAQGRKDPTVRSRDPNDDYLLALLGEAEVLVTGDDDLLAIKSARIVRPRAFLTALAG